MSVRWERRASDDFLMCPNCRRWTPPGSVDNHLRGLCRPADERKVKHVVRRDHATAAAGDVAVLREAFERGGELDKGVAWDVLHIPNRRFRAAVSQLRLEGYPVVSWSEKGSKYCKALDNAELDEFIRTEIDSRISDLGAQKAALQRERHRWLEPKVDAEQQELVMNTEKRNTWSDD